MTTTDSKAQDTRDLKALYTASAALKGCRTCGLTGWDKALQSR